MTYELAKQLKDAGFLQDKSQFYYGAAYSDGKKITAEKIHISAQLEARGVLHHRFTYIACPTLSELIEACGDDFTSLEHHKDKSWSAIGWQDNGDSRFESLGDSPEQAVADLWLLLNKK